MRFSYNKHTNICDITEKLSQEIWMVGQNHKILGLLLVSFLSIIISHRYKKLLHALVMLVYLFQIYLTENEVMFQEKV